MSKIIPDEWRAEGIYFNLSADDYHASPSLGSGSLREILKEPTEFHYYWAGNPNRKQEKHTDALTFGSAIHAMVLEGPAAFKKQFLVDPKGEQGMLVTMDDLRQHLADFGVTPKGKQKAQLIEQVLEVHPEARIYDFIIQAERMSGKRVIDQEQWQRISEAAAHITKNPALSESFRGGKGEISVFFTHQDVRCKARFDYLKATRDREQKRLAVLTDLKSFATPHGDRPVEWAVNYRALSYAIQAALYMEALKAFKSFARSALVFGTDEKEDLDFCERIAATQTEIFGFVFYKSTGAPYSAGRIFSPHNPEIEHARRDITMALDVFKANMERFGPDLPWVNTEMPQEITRDDVRGFQ